MTKFNSLVPAHLDTLPSYKPGKAVRQAELESGVSCIKMASNENPFGPSPLAIEAMRRVAADIHVYPYNDLLELRGALAELNGIAPEPVMFPSGSTSFLDLISRTLLGQDGMHHQQALVHRLSAGDAGGGSAPDRGPCARHHFDLDASATMRSMATRG